MPVKTGAGGGVVSDAFVLLKLYAGGAFVFGVVPGLLIAGAVSAFAGRGAVLRLFGPEVSPVISLGVASVAGSVLSVCSCTVLPMFAGIYRLGAGVGPACAFLYAGPAVNIMAVVLTAGVLGPRIAVARAVTAVLLSLVAGAVMHLLYSRSERGPAVKHIPDNGAVDGPRGWRAGVFFVVLVGALLYSFIGGTPCCIGAQGSVYETRWLVTGGFALALVALLRVFLRIPVLLLAVAAAPAAVMTRIAPDRPGTAYALGLAALCVVLARDRGPAGRWFAESWSLARTVVPLLAAGVFVSGLLFGAAGDGGIVPPALVERLAGADSPAASLGASVAGTFMYFATLTEVPIMQGLLAKGMASGPALALLIAGPALSLPSMLVIRGVLGMRRTVVFIILVVIMAALAGMVYGGLFPGGVDIPAPAQPDPFPRMFAPVE